MNTLYFTKISLPKSKDFPHVPKFVFNVLDLAHDKRHNRLWVIMGNVQENSVGAEALKRPCFPFFSDDMGKNWNLVKADPALRGRVTRVETSKDGTTFLFQNPKKGKGENAAYRIFEDYILEMDTNEVAPFLGSKGLALGGNNMIYGFAPHGDAKGDEIFHYLGGNQAKWLSNRNTEQDDKIAQLDVGHDGTMFGITIGADDITGISRVRTHEDSTFSYQNVVKFPLKRVIVESAARVFGITEEDQMLTYTGEGVFLPVDIQEVSGDGKGKAPVTGPISGKIVTASSTEPEQMCLVTSVKKTKKNKQGIKVATFTNYAYLQVPPPEVVAS